MNDEDKALYEEAAKEAEKSYVFLHKITVRFDPDKPTWDELPDAEKDKLIGKRFESMRDTRERKRKHAALPEHIKEQIRAEIAAHNLEKTERRAREAKTAARDSYENYRKNARGRSASEIPWHNPSAPIVPTTPWDEITSEEDKHIRQMWVDFVNEWTGPDVIVRDEDDWQSPTAIKYLGNT